MEIVALWVDIEKFKRAINKLEGSGEFKLTVAANGMIWIDGAIWHSVIQGKPAIVESKLR